MDYAYAVKTLPQPNDAPAGADPAAPPPPEPQPPHEDDARPWAGDLYDEGDESDPAEAYASFSGQNGEQAWLDKAEDGTLTGWVRDETGQVWRYADADAWAIDVDDAGMAQTGGTANGAAPEDPAADPSTADPAAQTSAAGDPAAAPLDFATADDVADPAEGEEDPALPGEKQREGDPSITGEEEEPASDEEPAEDEEEDPAQGGKKDPSKNKKGAPKGKKGGKPWA
ncbi:hypothetical protein [Streptomyces rimosus]|uniref:hypothetical protein n=1 Tax=Streptomyces rimosus TaxID=1927 RepID=UPI0004C22D1B|nr:hypothetical protein [Streptomyces rimosus]